MDVSGVAPARRCPGVPSKEAAVATTNPGWDDESLGEEECLRLLGRTRIGRVAYTDAALPAIRPVSYTLRDGAVVIPTGAGSAFAQAVRGAVVALEADSYNDTTRVGWSVTVIGPSWVVTAGPSEDPDRCLVVVQLGIVRGWRTSFTRQAVDTADPINNTSA
jgi:hypothetical protein